DVIRGAAAERAPDGVRGRLDRLQIDALTEGRRADREDGERAPLHRVRDTRADPEPARAQRGTEELRQPGLGAWGRPTRDLRRAVRVDVGARHRVPARRQAGAGHQPDVAGADDGEPHATYAAIRQAQSRGQASQWIFVAEDGTFTVTPRAGWRTR